ncbi:iron-containing redox enzyme family protein [Micromonospora sp. HUAS LYJ1]|uniref:iron-containing redox enzyme family protein n=1 Tax=Micromonospora sp. HUAS LYJ1 TaxID=3061626 RepID=UPI002672D411|nr:iron-containing redox enzyme family protein [Micromonospora sp. HUAS LYJ1]WKU06023.1 iron-containing redox enzyme family protein [Micromonospora sp. HUAS LYJ1]
MSVPTDRRYGPAALPTPRGPVSGAVLAALRRPPHDLPSGLAGALAGDVGDGPGHPDPLTDEDRQLTLFLCYELHYRGWAGVDEDWEWQPSLLALRGAAERPFEAAVRRLVGPLPAVLPAGVPAALAALVVADDGPALAEALHRRATLAQFREFVTHRSIYHLREADPHSWALPRLGGPAKAALVEIQMDEYGNGRCDLMHAELFRVTMGRLGLDTDYAAHLDRVPAVTLAVNNLISLFGLHRRLRGALLGHLAAYEMTSSLPNRRYGNGLRRLGLDETAARFYDEHVEADAVHEQIAAHDLCGGLVRTEPALAGDVLLGAAAALATDRLFAAHLLDSWAAGTSSLRPAAEADGPVGAVAERRTTRTPAAA